MAYSILGSMNLKGMGALMTVQGGTTVDVLFHFSILLPTMQAGQVLILDNLFSHKNIRIVELFGDHGIHLLHTPPLS